MQASLLLFFHLLTSSHRAGPHSLHSLHPACLPVGTRKYHEVFVDLSAQSTAILHAEGCNSVNMGCRWRTTFFYLGKKSWSICHELCQSHDTDTLSRVMQALQHALRTTGHKTKKFPKIQWSNSQSYWTIWNIKVTGQ